MLKIIGVVAICLMIIIVVEAINDPGCGWGMDP